MKINDFPKEIPVFPLSNFIIFPRTSVPLNIFEPRYIDMINDSMKSNKMIGIIQPKISDDKNIVPNLYDIGCLGKITSFHETKDGRYLIELKGLIRFEKIKEINTINKYRILEVDLKKRFLNKSNEIITIDINKIIIVFEFVFKIGSRLSDCTIKAFITKVILNKLNKYRELKSISF